MRLSSTTNIWNFSLGRVLEKPIAISLDLGHIARKEFVLPTMAIRLEISNNDDQYALEKQLANYHCMQNKQTMSYNPRASAITAGLKVFYDDYSGEELMWRMHTAINYFFSELIAGTLSFFQRRRIIVNGIQVLPSQTDYLHLNGSTFSGEFIDSVGYGPVTISPDRTQDGLDAAIRSFLRRNFDEREQLIVLLRRFNDILNLPYIYERFESCWRIVESLGRNCNQVQTKDGEIERLFAIAGVRKDSRNLRSFVKTLFYYEIEYDDNAIAASFKYRNESTHNYLSKSVIDDPTLMKCFIFVEECVDKIIAKTLGIDIRWIEKRSR